MRSLSTEPFGSFTRSASSFNTGLDLAFFPLTPSSVRGVRGNPWRVLELQGAAVHCTAPAPAKGSQPCPPAALPFQLPPGYHRPLTQDHALASQTDIFISAFIYPGLLSRRKSRHLQGTAHSRLLPESPPHPLQVEPVSSSSELFSDFLLATPIFINVENNYFFLSLQGLGFAQQ